MMLPPQAGQHPVILSYPKPELRPGRGDGDSEETQVSLVTTMQTHVTTVTPQMAPPDL